MYASISRARLRPDADVDAFIAFVRDTVAPQVRARYDGVLRYELFVDRDARVGVAVVVYRTREAAERPLSDGGFDETVAQLSRFFVPDSTSREVLEVHDLS